jgi:hypothetical protein
MLFDKIARLLLSSEKKRRSSEAFFNQLSLRLKKYGSMLGWMLTVRFQLFGLMFQLGSLFALLSSATFHDLAFAWQTTLGVTPEYIHDMISLISLPWRSWAPDGLPSIANVAGSHVVLKDGIANLDRVDMASWWKFICYAIVFYGVLPRMILLAGSWVGEMVSLYGIDFHDTESSALFRRMTSPVIAADEFVPDPPLRDVSNIKDAASKYYDDAIFNVLVPDDIPAIQDDAISSAVAVNLHGRCGRIMKVTLDCDQDVSVWESLPANESVLVVQEGWQPCTMEYLDYLKLLRRNLAERQLVVVGLTGRDAAGVDFDEDLYKDWQYQLVNLRDPALEAMKFVIGRE